MHKMKVTRAGFPPIASHFKGQLNMHIYSRLIVLMVLTCSPLMSHVQAAENPRLPKQFPIVFTFGYQENDMLPTDPTMFEIVVKRIKAAHFNTIMGSYADWKLDICKKHDMQFIVNLLTTDHHVYKNLEGAEALCKKLRGNETVWGYHLYSDMNYKTAKGRSRDIDNVHRWDPTHPTFVGSYKLSGNNKLENPDVHAYYDFHWQRGPHMNFPHLISAMAVSKSKGAYFYRWMRVTSGKAGKGNPNRCLYTANTSIACGLKGVFWFIGQEMMDTKTYEWNQFGKDIVAVNAELIPLGPELMKLGNPQAVFSTPTSKTLKDREKEASEPAIPTPLQGIPSNHWLQVKSGEALIGCFEDDQKRRVVVIANHNTYASQKITLSASAKQAEIFNRQSKKWTPIEGKDMTFSFELKPAGAELVRFVD